MPLTTTMVDAQVNGGPFNGPLDRAIRELRRGVENPRAMRDHVLPGVRSISVAPAAPNRVAPRLLVNGKDVAYLHGSEDSALALKDMLRDLGSAPHDLLVRGNVVNCNFWIHALELREPSPTDTASGTSAPPPQTDVFIPHYPELEARRGRSSAQR